MLFEATLSLIFNHRDTESTEKIFLFPIGRCRSKITTHSFGILYFIFTDLFLNIIRYFWDNDNVI
jgi:hypothetical protein